jgi:DNA invertase Pin-like site-specific DNA recombinase
MNLPHGTEDGQWYTEKLLPRHWERLAVVYVRQSTMQQVLEHQESTRLQYGLVRRAVAWGWPEARVLVIDDDLGRSGTSAEGRQGFQRLVAEVGLDHVGLILGVEMSRLARSSKDWHQLLEICALFGTLIADLDGIYDPSQYNDRLLLGLKGTMSEAELHLLKQRMHQGTLQKARRGALRFALPIGYVHNASGEVVYDPDAQVQHVVRLIFRKFDELGTLHALLRYLVQHSVQLGVRLREGPTEREAGVAPAQSHDPAKPVEAPNVCRSLRVWQTPDRSSQTARRPPQYRACYAPTPRLPCVVKRACAGLHHLDTV